MSNKFIIVQAQHNPETFVVNGPVGASVVTVSFRGEHIRRASLAQSASHNVQHKGLPLGATSQIISVHAKSAQSTNGIIQLQHIGVVVGFTVGIPVVNNIGLSVG